MPTKKQIKPGEKVPLKLTAMEQKLVLEDVTCLALSFEKIVRDTQSGKPVLMTLDELDEFGGYLASAANHCDDKKKQKKLDTVFEKVQRLLHSYADDVPSPTLKIEDARREQAMIDQAAQIALFAAQALETAELLRIKTKPLDNFWLAPGQRDVLLMIPSLPKTIKNKVAKEKPLTVAEVVSMTMAVAEDLPGGETQKQMALMMVTKHLIIRLQEGIIAKAESPAKWQPKRSAQKNTDVLYQFKITLLGSEPLIWRRIQVQDCTLDKLHEHIQTAMGWTNSHLHQFRINGERYGDPELLDQGFEDFACEDSTTTMLSNIPLKSGKRFAFKYEYDFGDCWEHEIVYEGHPPQEKSKKYPLCLDGERACPPEDVGGVWGYAEFLDAIADPQHEQHDDFMEWAGEFDPAEFNPKKASRKMKKGLPDWRGL